MKRAGVDKVQLKPKRVEQERIFQNLDSNGLCGRLQMQTYFAPSFRVERSDERKYICKCMLRSGHFKGKLLPVVDDAF